MGPPEGASIDRLGLTRARCGRSAGCVMCALCAVSAAMFGGGGGYPVGVSKSAS